MQTAQMTQSDYYGTIIFEDSDLTAIYAVLQPDQNLSLPTSGQTLYGGTAYPANNASLEAVVAFHNDGGTMERFFGIWDMDSNSFQLKKHFDNDFYDNYVFTENGHDVLYTIVEKIDNRWYVFLYNNQESTWEQLDYWRFDGLVSDKPVGWSSWEAHFGGNCPSVPELEARNILVKDNGNWQAVTSTYGDEFDDWNSSCTYDGTMIANFYNWSVDD